MANNSFVLHCMFDLRRNGLVKHDTDESMLMSSPLSQDFTTRIDARSIADIHNEMEDILNESSAHNILLKSNKFRSKWIYTVLIYILILSPLNIFFMFHSAKHNDIISFISNIVILILTLITIYKMEYYFMFSVYSFLSWNYESIILLREYSHNALNIDTRQLKCGISYDTKYGLYQLIGDIDDEEKEEKEQETQFTLYYRFNEDYIAPIISESFNLNDIQNKGIQYYHEWSKFVAEFHVILNKFQHQFEDKTMDDNMRIKCVHQSRLSKIRESTLKQIRRIFMLFSLLLIIGIPLIMNDNHESVSFTNTSTWILMEGVLFLVFTLLTMPCCPIIYRKCCRCFGKANDNKHQEQLVDDKAHSKMWINCIINEIEDFCNYFNSQTQFTQKYTFSNQNGFYETPNDEHYTGKICIKSM